RARACPRRTRAGGGACGSAGRRPESARRASRARRATDRRAGGGRPCRPSTRSPTRRRRGRAASGSGSGARCRSGRTSGRRRRGRCGFRRRWRRQRTTLRRSPSPRSCKRESRDFGQTHPEEKEDAMREDLVPGNPFPDFRLPEHTGKELSLSEIASAQPLVLCLVRGWWCPKEQVRARTLVTMQAEIQREYGKIAAVTVDPPAVNGAFRAGIGAHFPWLSDEDRRVAEDLDLVELTDAKHRPFLPFTFVLDSRLRIHRVWCGFWYWGNPTPEELRQALREIARREQPTYDPQPVWEAGGSAPLDAGIEAETIWIRE